MNGCLTHNIFYLYFLCLLLLMPIMMVFLAPFHLPPGFLLPPPLRLLFFVQLMLLILHHILKLATHTHRHLDHFHSLATSCMWLLLMNIGSLCSSPTNILLNIINEFYSFNLSNWLAMNYPLKLVSSCSWNLGQTTISRWHTLCIPTHYFLIPNILL